MASIGEENGMRLQSSSVNYNMNCPLPIIPQEKTRNLDPNSGPSYKAKPRTLLTISYHECLKNYAASTGGNVTDGCGEFVPSGEEGTLEALKCAACNCHRNFHRKHHQGHGENKTAALMHPLLLPPSLPSPSTTQHRGGGVAHWTSMVQPVRVAFKGVGGDGSVGTDSSTEELNVNSFMAPAFPHYGKKKQHRTKFTAEQKEKMLGFAEKLGWRIPREDDTEVQQFCGEVGVRRHVFKVWMHNNKISSKKTPREYS